jgi:hypothetical protein
VVQARAPRFEESTSTGKLARVLRVSGTTIHAVAVLGFVEGVIRWVALPRLSRMLGVRLDWSPRHGDADPMRLGELPPRARRQIRCANRVADIWPFSKGPCLRRSLVAGRLLRRYDPAIRIGIGGSGDQLVAHAWLEINGRPLESIEAYEPFSEPTLGSTASARR